MNPLTLADVLVAPVRDRRLAVVQAAVRDLKVVELPFPPGTAVRLAQLRATTTLKLPGCCVLLTVHSAGAALASFDRRLVQTAVDRNLPLLNRP